MRRNAGLKDTTRSTVVGLLYLAATTVVAALTGLLAGLSRWAVTLVAVMVIAVTVLVTTLTRASDHRKPHQTNHGSN